MTQSMHLHPEALASRNGRVVAAAVLDGDGVPSRRIWYEVDEEHAEMLSPNCDHFVLGVLYLAMQEAQKLHVHGAVSSRLLANLDEYQQAWRMWCPDLYRVVEISADEEVSGPRPARSEQTGGFAVAGFSGGVDSCFTAFRHATGANSRRRFPLSAGMMVHGFDIPLSQPDVFQHAAVKSRRMLNSLGLDLVTVATNLREHKTEWPYSFGAALASTLMLLQGRFSYGLISQGVPYGSYRYFVNGSNPVTDPLLSSGSMEIVPDAAGFERADKILAMKDWTEFNELLRVCWRGAQLDRNCCDCEKCIRNILTFRLLGLGLPACFPSDVTDARLAGIRGLKEITISYGYEPLIRRARESGLEDSWVRALERGITESRRVRRSRAYEYYDYYKRRVARAVKDVLKTS